MSKNNENEFSNTPNEKQNLPHETEDKEKVQDSNSAGKQKASKRGTDIQCQKIELKMNTKSLNDPTKTKKQIDEKNTTSPTIYKYGLSVDHEPDFPSVKRKRENRNNRGNPRLGNRDAANSLSVGGTGDYLAYTSKPQKGKQFSPPKLMDQSSAKSTPSVNTAESFDQSDVPYENLETNPKISLALIDPSSNTASEDASDIHCQSDLTDPAEEYVPTRYENNSSYAAAIRGGASLSLSESWKGALETSCSSSIQGSHESLKYDTSQQDDHTLRGNISATPSASPKLYHGHENGSPLSGGNVIIPLITTNLSEKDASHSPSSSFTYRRKLSHGSHFTRQQSQPSPIDQRYMYRGIRRSISNKMPTNEEVMLRHVCSLGGIETEERSGCCLKKHHCCSLHNCGIPTNAYYIEEGQREHGGSPCNYLHVQNEPNIHFQCHHGHTSSSRICRNGACRDTTTHIIGSSLCINQGADSIATIAADSLKFKGATKKFNQV